MSRVLSLLLLFISLAGTVAAQITVEISGPTSAMVNDTQEFTVQFFGGTVDPDTGDLSWYTANGDVITQTGTSCSVTWATGGTAYLEYSLATWDNFYFDDHAVEVGDLPPSTPTATAATSIASTSFTANWNAEARATSYRLDVSSSSAFSSFVSGYNNLAVSGTSQNVTGLSAGTTYYYRVRAVNASGTSGSSGTMIVPGGPATSAITSVTTTSFTANWSAVTGAASYRLDVSPQSNFSTYVSGYNNLTVSGTSQSVTGLTANTTYYYRVRAVANGGTSVNSGTATVPGATIAAIVSAPLSTSFTATWASVTGATGYRLDVSASDTFSSFVSGYNNLTVSGTSQGVTGLTANTTYYIRVRAVANGGTSASSNVIIVPGAPVANAATSKTNTSFTANWSSVTVAASYRLDVSTQSNFSTFVSGYNNLTVSGTSKNVTGLDATTAYYYRVRAVTGAGGISANSGNGTAVTEIQDYDQNFIKTAVAQKAGITTDLQLEAANLNEKQVTYQYFDGLGRPVQTVSMQQSPGHYDVVQPMAYDAFGREAMKYLPYVSGNNGSFKTNFLPGTHEDYATSANAQYQFYQGTAGVASDTKPYSETIFEASPLNRPDKDYGAGAAWHTNNKYIQHSYQVNQHGTGSSATQEKVIAWDIDNTGKPVRAGVLTDYIVTGGYYTTGQLNIRSTKDEQGNEVREYTNKSGQVVLKKVQAESGVSGNLNSATGWALTYYVYDDLGNLRFVFPPEMSKVLHGSDTAAANTIRRTNWAFQYTYDSRKRMITKQVPGAGPLYMVYDKRDRLVLMQDANQRSGSNKYWSFTKYDALNRPVLTGIHMADSVLSQAKMQRRVNAFYAGSGVYYETVGNVVHGYTNQSYPPESTANNYLTVTYHDNYAFKSVWQGNYDYTDHNLSKTVNGSTYYQPGTEFLHVTGQVTGTKTKVLDGGVAGGYTWLKSITYYDDQYRPVQIISDNYKGGADHTTNVYDFTGKVLITQSIHNKQNVIWTNKATVREEGNKIMKDGAAGWGNSGASSTQTLAAGEDGWLQFTVSENTNSNRVIGLSDSDPDQGISSIKFAVYQQNSNYYIYENGVWKYSIYEPTNPNTASRKVQPGDVMRIERVSGAVKYYWNNLHLWTSSSSSTSSLLVDAAFNNDKATLVNPTVSFGVLTGTTTRTFDYDHAGRLLNTWHQLGSGPEILLVKNEYNELGQLIDKKLHSTDGERFKQSVDHAYNIRGWLTKINESDLSAADEDASRDLFGMQLGYNDDLGISSTALYNGNISGIKWSNNQALGDIRQNAYTYTYDELNRIKTSVYKEKESSWTTASNYGNQETGFTYDLNGNILTLQRNDRRASGWMDNLTYSYGTGSSQSNRLMKVTDQGDKTKGFVDVEVSYDDYVYDANGNLTWDRNKGGAEQVTNGSFDNGSTSWTLTNSARLTFVNGEVQVAAGASVSSLRQSAVIMNRQYVLQVDMERTAGTLSVIVGGTTANFTSTGLHTVSLVAGTSNTDLTISLGTTFAGKVKSITLKGVTTITYNLLNLPETVTRPGDRSLRYIYDAAGRKLRQEVSMNNALEKSTDYAGEYIYENDTLQLINHEEGRIIPGTTPEYQYHLKDHLGNVRMTFTSKHEADTAVATMETANVSEEQGEFIYYNEAVKVNSTLFDHTSSGATHYAARLTGTTNERFGLAKSISVMPGDTIRTRVFAKYLDTNSGNWTIALNNLMTAIANNTAPAGTVVDGGLTGSTGGVTPPLGSLLDKGDETGTAPKAYLNYLVFDRRDTLIDAGFVRVSTAAREYGQDGAHEELFKEIAITEAGYVYLYLSNDNVALGGSVIEVFFDDFTVEHVKSPVVQQDDYYAFGLNFNSYSRENSTANKYLYNGKEKQDELDLGWMDYGWRQYDPSIARWMAVDPWATSYNDWSPYNYGFNNPIRFSDFMGLGPDDEVKDLPKNYSNTTRTVTMTWDPESNTNTAVETIVTNSGEWQSDTEGDETFVEKSTTSVRAETINSDGKTIATSESSQTTTTVSSISLKEVEVGKGTGLGYTMNKVTKTQISQETTSSATAAPASNDFKALISVAKEYVKMNHGHSYNNRWSDQQRRTAENSQRGTGRGDGLTGIPMTMQIINGRTEEYARQSTGTRSDGTVVDVTKCHIPHSGKVPTMFKMRSWKGD